MCISIYLKMLFFSPMLSMKASHIGIHYKLLYNIFVFI